MKKLRSFLFLALFTFLISFIVTPVSAAAYTPQKVQSKAAILVDSKTGQVIASKNSNKSYPMASLSKMIVVYMIEQKISRHELSHSTKVKIPKKIAKFSQNTQVANVPMSSKKEYTIKQLETAALLPSSNSAAMMLAHLVSGNQKKYYAKAGKLLDSWGISDSTIVSASGLPNSDLGEFTDDTLLDSAENQMSAREIAIIARHLITDYPDVLNITELATAPFPGANGGAQQLHSTDKLLSNKYYKFKGVKTGITPKMLTNFVGYTTLKGRPVISVVLNSSPDNGCFVDTLKLLTETNENTSLGKLPNKQKVRVINAKEPDGNISLKGQDNLKVFIPNSGSTSLKSEPKVVDKNIKAPIKKGKTLMKERIEFSSSKLNDYLGAQPTINYSTQEKIDKANIFAVMFRHIKAIF